MNWKEERKMDKHLVIIILVNILLSSVFAELCPRGWSHFRNSCYFFSNTVGTWYNDVEDCEEKDSHLLRIESQQESNFITLRLKGRQFDDHTFIGGTDELQEGEWVWMATQRSLNFTNWYLEEPRVDTKRNCLAILPSTNEHRWSDDDCLNKYRYICEKESEMFSFKDHITVEFLTEMLIYAASNEDCSDGWSKFSTSCYYFSDSVDTWYNDVEDCEEKGAHLLRIDTQEESDFITLQLKSKGVDDHVFIDGTDELQEGEWVWMSTQRSLNFTNWYPIEPNGDTKTNCLVIYPSTKQHRWGDAGCLRKYRYICEKETQMLTTTEYMRIMHLMETLQRVQQQEKNSYIWNPFKNRYYYFSDDANTWNGAKDDCSAKGSHLLRIESQLESDYITLRLNGKQYDEHMYIDGYGGVKTGQWIWMSNQQTLNFTNWYPGQPSMDRIKSCLTILPSKYQHQWGSVYCHSRFKYICEKRIIEMIEFNIETDIEATATEKAATATTTVRPVTTTYFTSRTTTDLPITSKYVTSDTATTVRPVTSTYFTSHTTTTVRPVTTSYLTSRLTTNSVVTTQYSTPRTTSHIPITSTAAATKTATDPVTTTLVTSQATSRIPIISTAAATKTTDQVTTTRVNSRETTEKEDVPDFRNKINQKLSEPEKTIKIYNDEINQISNVSIGTNGLMKALDRLKQKTEKLKQILLEDMNNKTETIIAFLKEEQDKLIEQQNNLKEKEDNVTAMAESFQEIWASLQQKKQDMEAGLQELFKEKEQLKIERENFTDIVNGLYQQIKSLMKDRKFEVSNLTKEYDRIFKNQSDEISFLESELTKTQTMIKEFNNSQQEFQGELDSQEMLLALQQQQLDNLTILLRQLGENDVRNDLIELESVPTIGYPELKFRLDDLNTMEADVLDLLNDRQTDIPDQQQHIDEVNSLIEQMNRPILQDCKGHYLRGDTKDGVYTVSPEYGIYFQVYCDMQNGGWTVIQRRIDGKVSFDRNWKEYTNGFGNFSVDFWLGLNQIHLLTKIPSQIVFTLYTMKTNETATALYKNFYIESMTHGFKMHVNANSIVNDVMKKYTYYHQDGFYYHNNMLFSTRDVDNDRYYSGQCSSRFGCGGYWYDECYVFGCFNGDFSSLNLNNPGAKDIASMSIKIKR